jgi:flagellar protein FlaJ
MKIWNKKNDNELKSKDAGANGEKIDSAASPAGTRSPIMTTNRLNSPAGNEGKGPQTSGTSTSNTVTDKAAANPTERGISQSPKSNSSEMSSSSRGLFQVLNSDKDAPARRRDNDLSFLSKKIGQPKGKKAAGGASLEDKSFKIKKSSRKRLPAPLDFQDKFSAVSMRYFGKVAAKLEARMPTLGEDLLKSNYFIAPNAFLSVILFVTVLSIPVAVFGIVMMEITNTMYYAAASIIPLLVFGIGLTMPKSSRSSRATAVDGELAFVVGYLSVLISGGVSPVNLFKRLSTNKLYPACAKEARRIVINVDVLGMDPVSAIEKAARYCPNKVLSDFLSGYIAVTKIGGDISGFVDQKQKDIFTHRSMKLKSSTEFVGTLAEAYLAATVVMGISLFILQIVQAMVQKTGTTDLTMMYFYSGVFMPLISGVFIFLLHSMQTKEPMRRIKEHIIFLAGLTAVPVMIYVVPLSLPIYMKIGIGLAASTFVPAIMHIIQSKRRRDAEAMIPSFVLDLAEVRKTGMAPEKCIEQLATRNYGSLTKYVQRMASQVSWGVPLSKVLKDFGKDLNSWFVVSIGFILLEVVEVGGGTVGLFGSLAGFTQRTKELEKERTSMFRPYIFMPYVGAILTVASTVFIITMMTTQLGSLTERAGSTSIVTVNTDPRALTDIMLVAAVFQGWLMGIVGGKMAEWSVGAGYKHATALALICIITAYTISSFVKF